MSKAKKIARMQREAEAAKLNALAEQGTNLAENNTEQTLESEGESKARKLYHPKPIVQPKAVPAETKMEDIEAETPATEIKERVEEKRPESFSGIDMTGELPEIKQNTAIDKYNVDDETKADVASAKKSILGTLKGKSKGKKEKGLVTSPKTVQQSIPYISVYPNGIIETDVGKYTKSYPLGNVNFKTASEEKQETIFDDYGIFLNMFSDTVKAEITIFNRNIDEEKFRENTLLEMKYDAFDEYRKAYNKILESKIGEGKNNISREKYLTVSVEAKSIEEAVSNFETIDKNVAERLKKITGTDVEPMSIEERLSILYDIYNMDSDVKFGAKATVKGKPSTTFDLAWLRQQGISTKDIIAPPSMFFQSSYFKLGETFARTLYIDNLPTFLSTDIIPEIVGVPCNMLVSVHYDALKTDKAAKLVKNQLVNINANVIEAQKKAMRNGYGVDMISPDLLKAQSEAEKLLNDITSRNQKLFLTTLVATVFAESKEELEQNTKMVQSVASRFLCAFKPLHYQQEPGLTTSLPFANNKLYVQRLLTTESASLFIPYATEELEHENGMYYGVNPISSNMLMFNRTNSRNANGVILGTPGAGKSFTAKREMLNVFLDTNDDVFVIDPEREYSPMAKLLGGTVIKVAPGLRTHINPFDMDMHYGDDEGGTQDPIVMKSDFITSLCETMMNDRYGVSPAQKTIIDRCIRNVYRPYVEHMSKLVPKGITIDKAASPTLNDFYNELLMQPEGEAQNIALSIELYCRGSMDAFAHKTNVSSDNRFTVYDIKDIGSTLYELGLTVCLNDIWNKIIENKKKGKRTWFYIDEFYLLTQKESSAAFLKQVWKRARKWGGVPTGITQNVEDLLATPDGRGIINNCDFILMLNQSAIDRQELSAMLDIPPALQQYVTNVDAGHGLIFTGKTIVPFVDKFPNDNILYKAMTTKPQDVKL